MVAMMSFTISGLINYIISLMPSMLSGLSMTLKVFFITLVLSLPLGLVISLISFSKSRLLTSLINMYIWILRGSPLMLQLVFIFFGLPLVNISLSRFTSVILAFVLNYSAYFAETFRGGLGSISHGQYQAAKVLGFTPYQTFIYIILPQLVNKVLPAISNEVINLIKDSSLVYVVGLGELLRAGKIAANRDVNLLPLFLVGIIYLALTAFASLVFKKLELHFAYEE